MLLTAGADPAAVSAAGDTALHFAARCQNPDVVAVLLAAGVPPAAVNNSGATPLEVALEAGASAEVVDVLLEAADGAGEGAASAGQVPGGAC